MVRSSFLAGQPLRRTPGRESSAPYPSHELPWHREALGNPGSGTNYRNGQSQSELQRGAVRNRVLDREVTIPIAWRRFQCNVQSLRRSEPLYGAAARFMNTTAGNDPLSTAHVGRGSGMRRLCHCELGHRQRQTAPIRAVLRMVDLPQRK